MGKGNVIKSRKGDALHKLCKSLSFNLTLKIQIQRTNSKKGDVQNKVRHLGCLEQTSRMGMQERNWHIEDALNILRKGDVLEIVTQLQCAKHTPNWGCAKNSHTIAMP